MAHLNLRNRGAKKQGIAALVGAVAETIRTEGSALADRDLVNSISTEGFSDAGGQLDGVFASATDILKEAGFDETQISTEAMAVALAASGDPRGYMEVALGRKAVGTSDAPLTQTISSGAAGSMDYRAQAQHSLEAYDDKELRDMLPYSVVFNAVAARQDEFSETFFPTTVITPDMGGFELSVQRVLVHGDVKHTTGGRKMDFARKNLLDAAVDHSILADESTALVPFVDEGGSNDALFVAETAVATYDRVIDGVAVPTRPLAINKTLDLLSLSAFAPLVGAGVLDSTDAIDTNIGLAALYLVPAAGEAAIKVVTDKMARSQFQASQEGDHREMLLAFVNDKLILDKNTTAIDGTAVDALAQVIANDYVVRYSLMVNGRVNVQTGNLTVTSVGVTVTSITDAAGVQIGTASGAGLAIKNAVEAFSVAGYELNARRTNSNRRTRGLLLDVNVKRERYNIPVGSPITVPAPATSNREAEDLKALIAAARLRNSNQAVTALFNHADVLKAQARLNDGTEGDDAVPGIARWVVKPFFEERTLKLDKVINSISTHEKAADVAAALVNACRDIAFRMYQQTRYQAALDQISGTAGTKPVLIVGTDQVLIQHLMVAGDTRTFGTWFSEAKIVASMDKRLRNKIVMSFGRSTDGPDILAFGVHAWIPELAGTIPVSRNGGTSKETMVQPRNMHVPVLPAMAILNVEGLSAVLGTRTDITMTDGPVDNTYLTGHSYP